MRRAKGVVGAFNPLRKARQAAVLAQRTHAPAPPGQDLVRVGLVAHVPHQPVVRRVEHAVQRHRQLHGAQVGTEVAAGLRHAVQHIGAQLRCQRFELRPRQAAQIGRVVHALKQRVGRGGQGGRRGHYC